MVPGLREVKSSEISKAEEKEIRESIMRDVDFELSLTWTGKDGRKMHSSQRTRRTAQRRMHGMCSKTRKQYLLESPRCGLETKQAGPQMLG